MQAKERKKTNRLTQASLIIVQTLSTHFKDSGDLVHLVHMEFPPCFKESLCESFVFAIFTNFEPKIQICLQ